METVGSLENHLLFWQRVQGESESLTAYASSLTQLVKKCDFNGCDGVVLRDRLLTGIRDDGLRRDLVARAAAGLEPVTFQSVLDLATGFVVRHEVLASVKFQCPTCPDLLYSHESDLVKHNKKVHQVEPTVECPFCPETFTSHHGLSIHTSLRHKGSSLPPKNKKADRPKCPECNKVCASNTGLNLHMRLAHDKATKLNFACEQCPKTFSIKADLQKHYRKAHKAKGALQCRMCEDSFMTSRGLRLHQHKAHGEYTCEQCDQSFKSSGDLKSHGCLTAKRYTARKAESSISELCEVCGKSFRDPRAHVANLHCRQREHSCPQCEYSHGSAAGIRRHVRNCHGEKPRPPGKSKEPFMCNLCDKTFATKFTAEHHLKVVHLRETPYTCVDCQIGFKSRKDLATHVRIDHENKWFVCQHCPQKFKQKSDCKTHIKRVHLNQCRYQCKNCGKGFKSIKPYQLHTVVCSASDRTAQVGMSE